MTEKQTMVRSSKEVQKIMILQRYENALDAMMQYHKHQAQGIRAMPGSLESSLRTLLALVRPSMLKDDAVTLEKLNELLDSKVADCYLQAFDLISEWMYRKGFKWDDTVVYDGTDPEAENAAHDL
jgi:hypothetical protein